MILANVWIYKLCTKQRDDVKFTNYLLCFDCILRKHFLFVGYWFSATLVLNHEIMEILWNLELMKLQINLIVLLLHS